MTNNTTGNGESVEPKPATIPDWLEEVLATPKPAPTPYTGPLPAITNGSGTAYGRAALADELRILLSTTVESHRRNDQLNKSAFKLGQLVAGGELDEAEVVAELTAAAQQIGLKASEIPGTVRSGTTSGQGYPREPEPLPINVTEVELSEFGGQNGQGAGEDQQTAVRQLKATKASDIHMTATRWLWEDGLHCWIPLGHMVGLGGREGVGKSTVCADLVAKVTRGKLPGDLYGIPKGVIIVSTEDDWSATIKPRLVAAGADLDRVFRVNAIEPSGLEGILSLPDDLRGLGELIRIHDVALVILDPLLTLIHKGLDTHKDAEVRRALEPMTRMAHDTKVSVIGLVHVNKQTEGDLLNRIMASRALTGVPRAFLFCAKYWPSRDMEDQDLHTGFVFGQIKNNLAPKVMISLRYHMETEVVGYDGETDKDIRASKLIVDVRPIDQNVEDIVLEQEKARKSTKTRGSKAEAWLLDFLAGKGEVGAKSIVKAGREANFSRTTLYRARRDLEDRIEVTNLPTIPKSSTWKLLEEEVE